MTHQWQYRGGECKCLRCGLYLEPDGKVGKTPSSKGRKFKDPGCKPKKSPKPNKRK